MTSTLFIATLLGALTGYPLMKKWNALQLEAKDETPGRSAPASFEISQLWTVALLGLSLMIYQPEFVFVILVMALIAGLFPPMIMPLLAGMIFFGYFLNPIVSVAGFLIIAIPVIIANRDSFQLKNYSFKNVTLACALSVLLVESILLCSAHSNWMVSNPEMLTWMSGKRAVPSLMNSLKEEKISIKSAALKELKKYEAEAWPTLVQDFENGDSLQQRFTVEMGMRNGKVSEITSLGAASIKAFESAASSDEPAISKAAIDELVKLKAVPQLLAMLPKVELNRYWNSVPPIAFSALRTFKTEEVLPQIMKTFRNVPEKGLDYGVSREIARFGESAIPILLNSLASDDKYEVNWAQYSLLEFGLFAKPQLMEALKHGKGYRQYGSAIVLSELKVREVTPYLIEMLKDEEGRQHAIWCLGQLEDERGTPPLIALYRKSPDREILRNLGMTGGAEAKSFLKELMMKTPDPQVRQDALGILAQAFWSQGGKKNVISLTIAQLSSAEKEERQDAAKRLREFNEPSLLPFLIEADKREHKTATPILNCEIHATISAFYKAYKK
jgi:hypothetical protein